MTSERDFSRQVEMLLDYHGWIWKHDEPARRQSGRWATALRGRRGFPDYIAARGDRLIVAELKAEKGRLSDDQKVWLHALTATNIEVYVWRPADLVDIGKLLR